MSKKIKLVDNPKEFGQRLRAARKGAGFTQKEVGARLEGSLYQAAISRYEQGDAEPSLAILADLARLYGVSVDSLLYGEEHLPLGQVVLHLPRGDPGPVDKEQAKLLERALVVLRAQGPAQHYAGSLTNNINSFYKGVQDTNRLMAGSPGKKAAGDS